MSKKIYLAGPFFDDEQIDRIKRVENALENNKTINFDDVFIPRLHQNEDVEFGSQEWRKVTFNNDIDHIESADAVVAIVDFEGNNVDSGTAMEIGYAHKKGLPIIILKEKKDSSLNIMISQSLQYFTDNVKDIENYDFNTMPKNIYTGEVL